VDSGLWRIPRSARCAYNPLIALAKPLRRGGPLCPPVVTEFLIGLTIRSRCGCLALVPKSPVHTGTTDVAGRHFRLPALALNIPPRIALFGCLVGCGLGDVHHFCVGVDRCVRPHGNALHRCIPICCARYSPPASTKTPLFFFHSQLKLSSGRRWIPASGEYRAPLDVLTLH
jgi:hypothetical protein